MAWAPQRPLLRLLAPLSLAALAAAGTLDDSLPGLASFFFVPDANVDFAFAAVGAATMLTGRTVTDCKTPAFKPTDVVGDVAIVLTNTSQGCYTSATYSNGNFLVQPGNVSSGNMTFQSYNISPPAVKATSFAASGQMLYVRPALPATSYTVYLLSGTSLLPVANVTSPSTVSNTTYLRTGLPLQNLVAPAIYVLLPTSQAVPAPTRQVLKAAAATECMSRFPAASAVVGDLAVVTTKSSGSCWTDGRYNNDNYLVEKGRLVGSDGSAFTAYRVSPPATLRTQFIASNAALYFRAAGSSNLSVGVWNGVDFTRMPTVGAAAQVFTKTGVTVDGLTASTVYLFYNASQRISKWPLASATVEAAWLAGSSSHSLTARRFNVGGQPFVPERDWPNSPSSFNSNYGTLKRFFAVQRSDGREGVVWQDVSSRTVFMTWFAPDLLSADTAPLVLGQDLLEAAASDAVGQIILLMVNGTTPANKTASVPATLIKVSSVTGAELARKSLPTTKPSPGLNLYAYSASGASISWNVAAGFVGIVLSRFMTQTPDGLNHQGAIAFVVDASSLQLVKNHGQTSGHSFANSLTLDSTGGFLGMDLGDNYPRGVNLWRFTNASLKSRVVYNFKTLHATSATSPAGVSYPVYTNISTPNKTYYCWSNDNNVYTELAHPGVVEVSDGLLVFFAGERPPLDNSVTGAILNAPRNLGFVKVPKAIPATPANAVLSSGPVEVGGFYNFNGGWSAQQNQGINFLTNSSSMSESVSRLKTAQLAPGKVVLLWELWSSTGYNRGQFLVAGDDGRSVLAPMDLGYALQLPIADDPRVVGNRTVVYAGTPTGQLVRYELCVQDGCTYAPPARPANVAPRVALFGQQSPSPAAVGAETARPVSPSAEPVAASEAWRSSGGSGLQGMAAALLVASLLLRS